MIRRLLAAGGVAIAVMSPAGAGADEVSRADALFNAAKQLRDAGQYADACPQFAQSSSLAPGVGVSLYLADCYEHVGKTASAWIEFRKAEALARDRNDKRAEIAHARALALEPRLSGLTLAAPPATRGQGPEVLLDGARIPPQEWNTAMAVDPGDHVVTVNVAGQPSRNLIAHVDAGKRTARVEIDGGSTADAGPSAPATPASSPSEPATPSDHGATRRWVGIALLGAGAVGLGVGTAILLNNSASAAANSPSCAPPPPKDSSATVGSTIAFAAGGIALAAGLVLTVTTPNKAGVGVVAAPMLTAQGAGALVQARF
jgi:hypothetical protein